MNETNICFCVVHKRKYFNGWYGVVVAIAYIGKFSSCTSEKYVEGDRNEIGTRIKKVFVCLDPSIENLQCSPVFNSVQHTLVSCKAILANDSSERSPPLFIKSRVAVTRRLNIQFISRTKRLSLSSPFSSVLFISLHFFSS